MSDTTTVQSLAAEASGWFETDTWPDGKRFTRTRDGAPEWVVELVYDAHDGMLPDDWRYAAILSALDCIAEADDAEDAAHEWADAEVDAYTGARIAWLGSSLSRPGYCDDAAREYGGDGTEDIVDRIGWGQYQEAREVYGLVLGALEKRVEEVTA